MNIFWANKKLIRLDEVKGTWTKEAGLHVCQIRGLWKLSNNTEVCLTLIHQEKLFSC